MRNWVPPFWRDEGKAQERQKQEYDSRYKVARSVEFKLGDLVLLKDNKEVCRKSMLRHFRS